MGYARALDPVALDGSGVGRRIVLVIHGGGDDVVVAAVVESADPLGALGDLGEGAAVPSLADVADRVRRVLAPEPVLEESAHRPGEGDALIARGPRPVIGRAEPLTE